ncbi:hypothetical protein CK203_114010 [Vitis vinifera]|uniref:Uncharacterized protein n=1 Tax=Vitis vinifera TaxID=29760 RepID=A0A438C9A9_VITVI|nr:hypothetical protein CK203_114010 [Vitis vinifera]
MFAIFLTATVPLRHQLQQPKFSEEESLTVKKVSGLKREDSEGFFPENPGDQEVFKLNVTVG